MMNPNKYQINYNYNWVVWNTWSLCFCVSVSRHDGNGSNDTSYTDQTEQKYSYFDGDLLHAGEIVFLSTYIYILICNFLT